MTFFADVEPAEDKAIGQAEMGALCILVWAWIELSPTKRRDRPGACVASTHGTDVGQPRRLMSVCRACSVSVLIAFPFVGARPIDRGRQRSLLHRRSASCNCIDGTSGARARSSDRSSPWAAARSPGDDSRGAPEPSGSLPSSEAGSEPLLRLRTAASGRRSVRPRRLRRSRSAVPDAVRPSARRSAERS